MSKRTDAMASLQTLLTADIGEAIATALLHETDLSGDPQVAGDWEHVASLLNTATDLAYRLAASAGEQS